MTKSIGFSSGGLSDVLCMGMKTIEYYYENAEQIQQLDPDEYCKLKGLTEKDAFIVKMNIEKLKRDTKNIKLYVDALIALGDD